MRRLLCLTASVIAKSIIARNESERKCFFRLFLLQSARDSCIILPASFISSLSPARELTYTEGYRSGDVCERRRGRKQRAKRSGSGRNPASEQRAEDFGHRNRTDRGGPENGISSLPPARELTYTEGYRSGHNGAVLKTVRAVMSTRVRILHPPPRRRGLRIVRDDFFMLRSKSHLSFTPSLLLSKSKPYGRFMPRRQLRHSAAPGFDFVAAVFFLLRSEAASQGFDPGRAGRSVMIGQKDLSSSGEGAFSCPRRARKV